MLLKLGGRQVTQRAVRPQRVVVLTPGLDDAAGIGPAIGTTPHSDTRHGIGRGSSRSAVKKRALSAEDTADGLATDRLVTAYETLRQQVVGAFDGEPRGPGLALLLRQGMRAWMKGWARWLSTSASECHASPIRSWGAHPGLGGQGQRDA